MESTTPRSAAAVRRPQEVHPGIFHISGRNRSAHAYLIRGQRKTVLIDTCLPEGTDDLTAALALIDVRPDDIDIVLLTHEHADHAGGVAVLGRRPLVAAHRLAAAKLVLRDEFALMNQVFGSSLQDMRFDLLIDEGTVFDLGNYQLQVVHTPGHCSGALCFYEPNHRLLFSGDTIMAAGIVGGVLQSGNVSDYIQSLQRLATLRIARLLPGHGRLSDQPEADIAKGLERLHTLLGESKMLFQAMSNSHHGFDRILRSLRDLND